MILTPSAERGRLVRDACAALEIGRPAAYKAVGAGLLPDRAALDRLAAMPVVARARDLTLQGPVLILRTAGPGPAHSDDDRERLGVHVAMDDEELAATCLRWWRPRGPLTAAPGTALPDGTTLVVTVATIPVALYALETVEAVEGGRVALGGLLLARATGSGWQVRVPAPGASEVGAARITLPRHDPSPIAVLPA